MDTLSLLRVVDKNLPPILRIPLRKAYYQWNTAIELDESLVKAIQEYTGLDGAETRWLLRHGGRLNSDFWRLANPKNQQEIDAFYRTTPFYIFDLAWWHMTRFQRVFRTKAAQYAKGRLLDYGGGIGDFVLAFHRKGFSVDYADVAGRTFDFAKWLFVHDKAEIGMINLSEAGLSKNYDTIFCIDVIEHVPDAKAVLDQLASHLAPGGTLIITGLKINEESNIHPMHQKVNFSEDYPQAIGLKATGQPWRFVKRPAA